MKSIMTTMLTVIMFAGILFTCVEISAFTGTCTAPDRSDVTAIISNEVGYPCVIFYGKQPFNVLKLYTENPEWLYEIFIYSTGDDPSMYIFSEPAGMVTSEYSRKHNCYGVVIFNYKLYLAYQNGQQKNAPILIL